MHCSPFGFYEFEARLFKIFCTREQMVGENVLAIKAGSQSTVKELATRAPGGQTCRTFHRTLTLEKSQNFQCSIEDGQMHRTFHRIFQHAQLRHRKGTEKNVDVKKNEIARRNVWQGGQTHTTLHRTLRTMEKFGEVFEPRQSTSNIVEQDFHHRTKWSNESNFFRTSMLNIVR